MPDLYVTTTPTGTAPYSGAIPVVPLAGSTIIPGAIDGGTAFTTGDSAPTQIDGGTARG